jgi:hypothetical protein
MDNGNQVKKLTIRLWVIIFLLLGAFITISTSFYRHAAKAVFNNTKTPGSMLTAAEWNSLPSDIGVPANAVMAFNLTSCPPGWILADGTSGTPDLRGAFIRGMYGDQNGRDVPRTLGSYQADEFKSHTHNSTWYASPGGGNGKLVGDSWTYPKSNPTTPAGGPETRPKNVALIYCVKQ